jgi:hypothetical protein
VLLATTSGKNGTAGSRASAVTTPISRATRNAAGRDHAHLAVDQVGHSSTVATETVYRRELRPVIRSGADAMDKLFPAAPKLGPDSDASSDSGSGTVIRRKQRRRVIG